MPRIMSMMLCALSLVIMTCVLLTAVSVVSVVVYDLVALRYNWRTVSDEVYRLGHGCPVVAVVITGLLCLAVGMLIGHFFLGQKGD